MSVVLLSDDPQVAHRADRELAGALTVLGHETSVETAPDLTLSEAATYGHQLAIRWRDERPAVVLAHGWLAGLAAQIGCRDLGLPVVQRFSRLTRAQEDPGRARLEVAIARGAAVVLASCSEQADQLASAGVPRDQVRVLPLGVDTTAFSDHGPAWPRDHRRRLLVADTLERGEPVQGLIATLPALPECELLIVSRGPAPMLDAATSDVARELVASAQRRRVADRLRFVGEVDDNDLPPLLRSADLVVAAGHDDSAVSFVLRAMACGVPVVASEVGALSDAVADGVTGVLVPRRSPGRLGDAVRALLTDNLARETYGLAATDRANARFSWGLIAEATGEVIAEVLQPGWSSEAAS